MSRLFVWLCATLLFAACEAGAWSAKAADFRADQNVEIKEDEVIEGDLYAFGERVTVKGTVKGDLIVFAGQIVIKGVIEGDVAAAGQTVLVEGQLGDDARLAGQVIKLASGSHVKGDVLSAGLSIELEKGGQVDGDFVVAGYQADLSGDIQKKVIGALGNCRLAGAVGGDVELEVGGDGPPAQTFGPPPPLAMPHVPGGLTVDSTAKLDGKLQYTGPKQANIDPEAKLANEAVFKQQKSENKAAPPPTVRDRVLANVRHLATIGVLGLAMVLVLPRWSAGLADTLRDRPLVSLVGGVAGMVLFIVLLVVLVVAVIVLAILFAATTLAELSLAVVILGLLSGIALSGGYWLFTMYLAPAVVSLTLGRMIAVSSGTTRVVVPFLIGFVVVALLLSIPYVGGLIGWLVLLAGLGALGLWLFAPRPVVAQMAPAYPPGKPVP